MIFQNTLLQWAHIFYVPIVDVQGEWPPLNRKMTAHAYCILF